MNAQLSVFQFRNHHVRIEIKDNLPLFCLKDVAEILEIRDAKLRNFNLNPKGVDTIPLLTSGGKQETTFIDEPNLYRVIFKSRKAEALKFQDWIFEEVLPQIRQTGQYAPKQVKRRGRPPMSAKTIPLLRHHRPIRSRDDLSFTKRDANGNMINWFVPEERPGAWHEQYGMGEIWFSEIMELAQYQPEDAYLAMSTAAVTMAPYTANHYGLGCGHTEGFYARMARWAMAGILAHPDAVEPDLPFEYISMGTAPKEGMDFYLAAAAPQQPPTEQEQQIIDRMAWEKTEKCRQQCFQKHRAFLMMSYPHIGKP